MLYNLYNYDICSLCEAIYLHIHVYGDISERKQDINTVEKTSSNQ